MNDEIAKRIADSLDAIRVYVVCIAICLSLLVIIFGLGCLR